MADSNIKSNSQNAAHLLAILGWLVILISAVVVGSALVVNYMAEGAEQASPAFWASTSSSIGIGIAFLIVANGLKRHKMWARYIGGFLSFISLVAFPVGTVMGLFILGYIHKGWNET